MLLLWVRARSGHGIFITFHTLQPELARPTPMGASLGGHPGAGDTHGSEDGGTSQLATTLLVHKPRTGHSRTRNITESMRFLVPDGGSRIGCPDYGYTAVMTMLSTVGMHGRHQSTAAVIIRAPSHDASAPKTLIPQHLGVLYYII